MEDKQLRSHKNYSMHLSALDFAGCWAEMRRLALSYFLTPKEMEGDEITSVLKLPPKLHPLFLDILRVQCRRLGREVRRKMERHLTLEEIETLLKTSGIPCFAGSWKTESHLYSKFLYRGECPRISKSICCDYWHVAARSVVEGLNASIKMARHQSIGHGDNGCLDYLYTHPLTQRKWGIVPSYIKIALKPLSQRLRLEGVELLLHGFSERNLYWSSNQCGASLAQTLNSTVSQQLKTEISQRLPQLNISEHEINSPEPKIN